MANTSPGEFIRQVRTETNKVAWPTRRETMMTAVMVIIMTSVLGIFFFGVDLLFRHIVKDLLDFAMTGGIEKLWWIGGVAGLAVIVFLLAKRS